MQENLTTYSTYRWFSWGMASLPEGKSWALFSAVMCNIHASKCYIKSLPLVPKDKIAASLKVKGLLYSCLLIACLHSGSRTLN